MTFNDDMRIDTTGRINPELWTRGSSAHRLKWFTVGYQSGHPKQTNTYDATDLG